MIEIEDGLKVSGSAIAINLTLALVKVSTGVVGNSYALIADGIESTTDIFSSLIVIGGLRISSRPPDESHPYGHGKAESLAGLIVALFLLGAATLIAVQSIGEILSPGKSPAWYTLVVLGLVILVKEWLFRRMLKVGDEMEADIRWIRSYVLDEGGGALGTICIYEATSEKAIRQHAAEADLPVDEVIPIANTVVVRPDPV